MIGGTASWIGPLIGAVLLGTLQQVATVTISSAVNLLIVGVLLVAFVIIAPNGIVGLVQERMRAEGAIMTALAAPGRSASASASAASSRSTASISPSRRASGSA